MDERRMAGAITGGLVAGLGITALLMAGERKSGTPSEIVTLARNSADKLGIETPPADALPSAGEQAFVQGGHLLLSAAAGAVYAAAVDDETPAAMVGVIGSGLAFGAAFYAAMHWITGPLLGVKAPEWQSDAKTIGMHGVNHLAFGLVTALGAKLASRRSGRRSSQR